MSACLGVVGAVFVDITPTGITALPIQTPDDVAMTVADVYTHFQLPLPDEIEMYLDPPRALVGALPSVPWAAGDTLASAVARLPPEYLDSHEGRRLVRVRVCTHPEPTNSTSACNAARNAARNGAQRDYEAYYDKLHGA